ncbi:MAG: histidine triad nucleotide-binding protein [Chloroflexi bacterium 13_1_40CM_4_68_4]|nr:MAG: histidine triad nucleotide-binding protein [Chloroflexi bacterium 13_1_40CM_4_68_4]
MADCLFCKIVAGEIPAKVVFGDSDTLAIADLNPVAPLHVLVLPRVHVAKLSELEDERLGGHLLQVARRVAKDAGYADNFRVVVNNGAGAGQSVGHLHMHVLGGRQFSWPPG